MCMYYKIKNRNSTTQFLCPSSTHYHNCFILTRLNMIKVSEHHCNMWQNIPQQISRLLHITRSHNLKVFLLITVNVILTWTHLQLINFDNIKLQVNKPNLRFHRLTKNVNDMWNWNMFLLIGQAKRIDCSGKHLHTYRQS